MIAKDSNEVANQSVLMMQIITAALCFSVLLFMVIAILIAKPPAGNPNPAKGMDPLVIVAPILIFGALVARAIVPRIIVSQARQRMLDGKPEPPPYARVWLPGNLENLARPAIERAMEQTNLESHTDVGRLDGILQTKTIIEAALLEGPAFFCLIIYIMTQSWVPLAVAVAAVAWMLIEFPTRSRAAAWVQTQLEIIDAERTFSNSNPNQP